MNLDSVDNSIKDRWFKIFQSSFLILRATDSLKDAIKSSTVCDVLDVVTLSNLLVQHALIDWKSVKDSKGDDIIFSRHVASEALVSMPTLLQFVLEKTFKG